MTARFGRRAGLMALLAGLAACAQQPPEEQPPATPVLVDPEPERVYSPGAISWADLSDEHKRRASATLARMGDPVEDEATLQARWMLMSPAQQRYLIRRPPPPPARPAASSRSSRGSARRGTTPQRGRQSPQRNSTPQRSGTTQQRRSTPTPPRRPTTPPR